MRSAGGDALSTPMAPISCPLTMMGSLLLLRGQAVLRPGVLVGERILDVAINQYTRGRAGAERGERLLLCRIDLDPPLAIHTVLMHDETVRIDHDDDDRAVVLPGDVHAGFRQFFRGIAIDGDVVV